jgi:hypothetical protein
MHLKAFHIQEWPESHVGVNFVFLRECGTILFIHSLNRTPIAFQYERFFRPEATLVASVFAPIMFPPAPVLVYKEKKDNSQVIFSPDSLRSLCHLCVSTFKTTD